MSIRILPTTLQIIAECELNEKPDEIQENIRLIKEWISSQPHLRARTEDQWILHFLRGCKFSLQKTKQKIDSYYSLRTIVPEIHADRDTSSTEFREFINAGIFLPLKTNTSGPQCLLSRYGAEGSDGISFLKITKFSLMMVDILQKDDDYVIMGQCLIYDLKGMRISKLIELSIKDIKTLLSFLFAYPERIKRIIILNASGILYPTLLTFRRILGKKLGERMTICAEGDLKELHRYVPLSILPKEYGGEACLREQLDYWKQKMEDNKDWFVEDAVFGTDESKRIRTEFDEEIFGVDGSFRRLEID